MNPVPAILVTGAGGTGKQAVVRALLAARPAGERWAILDNDNGGLEALQTSAGLDVETVGGCLCCTGQILLQTGIVQLLRRSRPQRLIIVAAAAAEPAAVERALGQEHIVRAITVSRRLFIPPAADPASMPEGAQILLRQQKLAADISLTVPVTDAMLRTILDTPVATADTAGTKR